MYILIAAVKDEVAELVESERSSLLISGVGKLNAMLSVSEQFRKNKSAISCIINLGTAGSDRIECGQLVEVTQSFQRDTTFFSDPIQLKCVTKLPKVSCGSSDRIEAISKNDPWSIVDMELYALAKYGQKQGVPVVSFKYVTDRNDANVYKDWKKQLSSASSALSQFWIEHKERIVSELCSK